MNVIVLINMNIHDFLNIPIVSVMTDTKNDSLHSSKIILKSSMLSPSNCIIIHPYLDSSITVLLDSELL